MRILIISDTHGDVRNLAYVIREFGPRIDRILHLGDGAADLEKLRSKISPSIPCEAVRGNMDSGSCLPASRVTSVGEHRIYASHGNTALAGGSLLPLLYAAREAGAEACLFGHTHVPYKRTSEGVLLLNPGSLSRPRGGWGPTFAILDVPEDGSDKIVAVHYEILNPGENPSVRSIAP